MGRDETLAQVFNAFDVAPTRAAALTVVPKARGVTASGWLHDHWRRWLQVPAVPPVCVCGLGGIGKTSLVVEYAWRAHTDGAYPGGVYSVHAESLHDVVRSLRQLQHAISTQPVGPHARADGGMRPLEDLDVEVNVQWAPVRCWLTDQCSAGRPWLLVIDNVAAEAVLRTRMWLDVAAADSATAANRDLRSRLGDFAVHPTLARSRGAAR